SRFSVACMRDGLVQHSRSRWSSRSLSHAFEEDFSPHTDLSSSSRYSEPVSPSPRSDPVVYRSNGCCERRGNDAAPRVGGHIHHRVAADPFSSRDRKSTRLNSSHDQISYAVFCLKKKKI